MIECFEEKHRRCRIRTRATRRSPSPTSSSAAWRTRAATTQTDRTLHDERAHSISRSDPLVSHELAHQWFGDLLTCRDWAHAWLNEGFATFLEAVWREADLGDDEYLYDIFRLRRSLSSKRTRTATAARSSATSIATRSRSSTGISTKKARRSCTCCAASSAMRASGARSRDTSSDNAQRSVETIDFIRAIEEATGRNLRGFFNQWVYREGHPALEGRRRLGCEAQRRDGDDRSKADHRRRASALQLRRRDRLRAGRIGAQPSGAREPLPGERRIRAHVERGHETVTVPLDFEPKLVRFDPGSSLLAEVRYRLGADFAAAALRADPDVVARIRAARELATGRRARRARGDRAGASRASRFGACSPKPPRRSARRARRGP